MYFISLYAFQENITDVYYTCIPCLEYQSTPEVYKCIYVILCNNVWFSLVLYNYSGHEVILQYVNAKMLAIFF